MMILWAILIVILLFYYYYVIFANRQARIIDKTFPHPFRLPIINNLYIAIDTIERLYTKHLEIVKKFNYKTFVIWTHEKPLVLITDYKLAKMLLSSNTEINKALEYRFFEPWLGQGIFSAKADIWRKNRKLVNPAFHFQILQTFFKVFDSNADVLCEKFENHLGKEAFDVYQYVTLYALDNICDTSMGVNINAQINSESQYVKAIKKTNEILFKRLYTPWLRPDWLFKYTSTGKLQQKLLDVLNSYNEGIIKQRKIELDLNGSNGNNGKVKDLENNTKEKTVFLDLLLEINKDGKLTFEDIRNEVATVMLGGHDTAASSISFLLYVLAEHQDVQEKVYEEIESIFGSSHRCPTYEDVQEMKYTEQVIKETLRFYTVLPVIGRHLTEDLPIGGGKFIPKDTEVGVLLTAIHRDPELWSNPDVFDPDRFSPEASKNRHPFAFIPFSAGPRNCIGQKFAMHEMKITTYKLLRKFKLLPSEKQEDKVKVKLGVILTSVNGMKLRVQPRHEENGRCSRT